MPFVKYVFCKNCANLDPIKKPYDQLKTNITNSADLHEKNGTSILTKVIATQLIEQAVNKSSSDRMAVSDLIASMDNAGFGLALMIFSFGITIPLPPPFPSIISIPLVLFSLQMMIGYKSPKLPKKFSAITVKRSVVATLIRKASPYIGKIERILRPRIIFMTTPLAERIIGFFIFAFSSFILLPMPLSNFIPGIGILIISFGILGKDGLVIIGGILTGLIGIAISISTVILGVEAIGYLKNIFF